MEQDPIKDAHDKRLINYQHQDLIEQMLKNKANWHKMDMALASSALAKPLDKIDIALIERAIMN